MRLRLTPAARQDLIDHYRFLVEHNRNAAERLLDEAERLFELIVANPRMGVERSFGEAGRLRIAPIPHFREWLMFYRIDEHGPIVFRVIHAKRDIRRLL